MTKVEVPEHPVQLSQGLVVLFAVSCGLSAANLYYPQPVLHTIARSLGTGPGTAGLIVTFSQVGYAAGLALLVPLGDLHARRVLVPAMLVVTAAALAASAAAPDAGVLIAVALVVGAGSVVAQVLVPMAASLADDAHRGQVVGTVMSGLLMGILLARTVSGLVAGASNWRVVYVVAASVSIAMAVVLRRVLPVETERPLLRYRDLLVTAAHLVVIEPVIRRRALFGALGFAAFSAFWTTMAFLLAGAPYHYGDAAIGLFGLVGAAGALSANFAGRWVDREFSRATTALFSLCIGVSFVPLWWGRTHLVAMIVGIVVLDVGVQGLQVTNQSLIYRLAPELRSRITATYMVCFFAGGAVGSALGGALYDDDGWAGVCLLGAGIGVLAILGAAIDARPSRSLIE